MIPASCSLFLFLDNCSRESIHLSIHSLGCRGSSLSRDTQMFISSATSWAGALRLSQVSWETYSVHWVLGLPWGFSQLDSCPGGILVSCHDHLSWLFPMWRSTSSTLSPSQMTKVLNMSLKESSAFCLGKLKTATWKLISASISLFWLLAIDEGGRAWIILRIESINPYLSVTWPWFGLFVHVQR